MKRIVACLAVLASTARADAPLDHLVALIQTEQIRHVIYLQRDGHTIALTAANAAATVGVTLDPFGSPASRLAAVVVTVTLPTVRESTEYLVRVGRDGELAIACTFATQGSATPQTCGTGSHRTVTIVPESTAEEARRGITRFTVTRRELADFSEPAAGGGCRADTPIAYEPTITRYELGPEGWCSMVP